MLLFTDGEHSPFVPKSEQRHHDFETEVQPILESIKSSFHIPENQCEGEIHPKITLINRLDERDVVNEAELRQVLQKRYNFFLNFKVYLGRTHWHVLFWGHCYPCLGFLMTSPLGFKARVGSAIFAFTEASVMYIPQDPPLVLHIVCLVWVSEQAAY